MGGDLQATPAQKNKRSHYPPLTHFCDHTGLTHLTPIYTFTYIPAKTHIDHWLFRQPIDTQHYTPHNIHITTHTPEYGDHKTLTLELPQIGDIQPHKARCSYPNPTTRSHPPFILPILQNLINLYRLGNDTTTETTQHFVKRVTSLLISETMTTDQIDVAAAEVMTLIHTYHDIATKIWPMQASRQDTPTSIQLKSPISRAGLTQIGRLAKLRNECNTTTKIHPEIPDDSDLNPLHINLKINRILQPNTHLTAKEAHQQWSKAIGDIIRKSSHTLSDKVRDKT